MLEGVICLTEGLNPRLIRFKLGGYLESDKPTDEELQGGAWTGAGSPTCRAKVKSRPRRTTSAGWFPTPTSSRYYLRSLW